MLSNITACRCLAALLGLYIAFHFFVLCLVIIDDWSHAKKNFILVFAHTDGLFVGTNYC